MNLLSKSAKQSLDINIGGGGFIQWGDYSHNMYMIQDIAKEFVNDDTGYYVLRLTYVQDDWHARLESKTGRVEVQGPSFDDVCEKLKAILEA